jgi:hypothetical protein
VSTCGGHLQKELYPVSCDCPPIGGGRMPRKDCVRPFSGFVEP